MLRLIPFTLAVVLSLNICEPFGLRIYYGDIVIDPSSQEKLAIYFNTKDICRDSYVSMVSNNQSRNITCITRILEGSVKMAYYVTYIHFCSTNDITFEEAFNYTAYGWNATTQATPVPFKEQWIITTLIDPRISTRSLKIIAMADWGAIEGNKSGSTTNDLKTVISQKNINAIMVAGDIAYDLDTLNGQIYEDFLGLMQEFSPRLPFFLAPGNHERKTVDAASFFNESFKVYGIDKKLATGIYFGSIFLAMFDPYNIIYSKPESISSLTALKTQLVKGSQSGRFIIPFSHYPLQCSGEYIQCADLYGKLKLFYDAMLDYGVSLYVGAHTHTYQRAYPYYRDGTFSKQQSPYTAGKYIISIVEGVAGSNRTLLLPTDPAFSLQPFTAKYVMNETGFAVIESTKDYVIIEQYSTKRGWIDSFIVNLSSPQNIQSNSNIKYVLIFASVLASIFFIVLSGVLLKKILPHKNNLAKDSQGDVSAKAEINEYRINEGNIQSKITIEQPKIQIS